MPLDSHYSRRDALRLISGTALCLVGGRLVRAADLPATKTPTSMASVLTPELTEGPYYIDLEKIRRDITEGKAGIPLRMRIKVVHVASGAPIPDAAVDIWHCDAQGVYSGFSGHMGPPPGGHGSPPLPPGGMPPSFGDDDYKGPPPGGPGFGPDARSQTDNKQTFLRGVQVTNASGATEIDTIYPGWYPGRTTHIHIRVHLGGSVADGRYQGGHITHTGQIFFSEETTDRVYQLPAYTKAQVGRMALTSDGIFNQGGSLSSLTPIDSSKIESGFFSDTLLVIDPAATPRPA